MRKAQFEAIGLAIIVILISVIIFFALALTLNPEPNTPQQVEDEQFNQNMLDALLKTNLEGCRGTVKDYLLALDPNDHDYSGYPTPKNTPATNLPAAKPACATSDNWYELEEAISNFIKDYSGRTFLLEVRKEICKDIVGPGCEDTIQTFHDYVLNEEVQAKIDTGCNPGPQQANRAGRQLIPLYPRTGSMEIVLWVCEPRQF